MISLCQDEVTESKKQELSHSEIQQKIKEYNAQINSNLFMSLVRFNICLHAQFPTYYMYFYLILLLLAIAFINHQIPDCLTQNKNGTFNGFIKVHLKLVRPVSVPPQRKGATSQESANGKRGGAVKRRTSFYLPKDTAKHLHISSQTRAQEVIQALLKKFTVIDNPAKFALFERTERHDQGTATFRLLMHFD